MMKRHSVLSILFAAGVLAGCSDTTLVNKTDSLPTDSFIRDTLTKPQAGVPEKKKFTANALGCYYVQDNQYAGSPNSAGLFTWLKPFIHTLNENGIDRNN